MNELGVDEKDLIGCHLVTRRTLYTHHGLYIGNNRVLEYLDKEGVSESSFEDFAEGEPVWIIEHTHRKYNGHQAVERGLSRLGEKKYNLINNNCEHFVNWCIEGKSQSSQVNNVVVTMLVTTSLINPNGRLSKFVKSVAKYASNSYKTGNELNQKLNNTSYNVDYQTIKVSNSQQNHNDNAKTQKQIEHQSNQNYAVKFTLNNLDSLNQTIDAINDNIAKQNIQSKSKSENEIVDNTLSKASPIIRNVAQKLINQNKDKDVPASENDRSNNKKSSNERINYLLQDIIKDVVQHINSNDKNKA